MWSPMATGWRTSHSTYATDCASTGAPVTPSTYGNPLSVCRARVDLDGLGELADDRTVLAVDDAQTEHAARGDQLVRERVALDARCRSTSDRTTPASPSSASCRCAARPCRSNRRRRARSASSTARAAAAGRTRRGPLPAGNGANRAGVRRHDRRLRRDARCRTIIIQGNLCGGSVGLGRASTGMTEFLEVGDASLSYAVRGRGRGLLVPWCNLPWLDIAVLRPIGRVYSSRWCWPVRADTKAVPD